MASADNNHRLAATMRACDYVHDRMPPNARLWLAVASGKTDPKGRTRYSAEAYHEHTHDSLANGNAAIQWLLSAGIIVNDTNDEGQDCWRLTHHEWDTKTPTIGGYSKDAGLPRDGYPPAYGRTVDQAIGGPNPGAGWTPPPGATWQDLANPQDGC